LWRIQTLNVYTYKTAGGKDLIMEFILSLDKPEKAEGLLILKILKDGSSVVSKLKAEKFDGAIWEIKFKNHNRIFFVFENENDIYLLHACKKQKNKTELKDKRVVIQRCKEMLKKR
jgi:phage-related protein